MNPSFSALILTLFPEMFPGPLGLSLAGKALERGLWQLSTLQIRDFATDKHQTVDDSPYGGGAGMVMRADVLDAAIQHARTKMPEAQLIYFTPRGVPLTQKLAHELVSPNHLPLEGGGRRAAGTAGGGEEANTNLSPVPNPPPQGGRESNDSFSPSLILLCGRYEGVDERLLEAHQPLEISIGDYVLSGGEVAAHVLLDACVRLLPGVVGKKESLGEESFGLSPDFAGLLEYPHYTRPPQWNGRNVPDVLLSGNHAEIQQWRKQSARKLTQLRRPELLKNELLKKVTKD